MMMIMLRHLANNRSALHSSTGDCIGKKCIVIDSAGSERSLSNVNDIATHDSPNARLFEVKLSWQRSASHHAINIYCLP
eukprot:scaffold178176_cov44-Prasinocladus_malaysianus.AAC.2